MNSVFCGCLKNLLTVLWSRRRKGSLSVEPRAAKGHLRQFLEDQAVFSLVESVAGMLAFRPSLPWQPGFCCSTELACPLRDGSEAGERTLVGSFVGDSSLGPSGLSRLGVPERAERLLSGRGRT